MVSSMVSYVLFRTTWVWTKFPFGTSLDTCTLYAAFSLSEVSTLTVYPRLRRAVFRSDHYFHKWKTRLTGLDSLEALWGCLGSSGRHFLVIRDELEWLDELQGYNSSPLYPWYVRCLAQTLYQGAGLTRLKLLRTQLPFQSCQCHCSFNSWMNSSAGWISLPFVDLALSRLNHSEDWTRLGDWTRDFNWPVPLK